MRGAGRPIAAIVADGSLRVLRRHVVALAGLALLASAPPVALLFATAAGLYFGWIPIDFDRGMDRAGVVALALWAALSVVQAGAATSGTLRALDGQPFGFRMAVIEGLRRAPVVGLVGVVTAAAVLAGTAVLVLPGAAALASLCAALPAAVAERTGPFRAIARSLDLTRGDRAGLFAAAVAVGAASAAAGWGPALLIAEAGFGYALVVPAWLAFTGACPAVAAAVAYAELRRRKEAPVAVELERVFE